ncbi:E3 SUMO-protein ligase NSE2-like [Bradysia coprophila]|uniref:E3 SUMO-protein ligase NSE2-like n=1 Tax=Bradysia coprophila TaxID=38358 RepID=UPI00187DAC96|nr:E3 SUMO-protein ligase NSE2-like [Bradysia coprophila]
MEVSTQIEKIITSLKKTCELAIKCDSNANLDEFLAMAAKISQVDLENANAIEAMESAAEAQTEEEFDVIFRRSMAGDVDDDAVKRHHIYKNFERFTRDLLSKRMLSSTTTVTQTTVTNDMEITETSHAIDPITKGPLVRPVRNKHCNHIYGYQSVIDSLAINRRLRCPMVGCSNKTFVSEQDLIEL